MKEFANHDCYVFAIEIGMGCRVKPIAANCVMVCLLTALLVQLSMCLINAYDVI